MASKEKNSKILIQEKKLEQQEFSLRDAFYVLFVKKLVIVSIIMIRVVISNIIFLDLIIMI
jgi:hypothetical protein